jgi:hypothetical protein
MKVWPEPKIIDYYYGTYQRTPSSQRNQVLDTLSYSHYCLTFIMENEAKSNEDWNSEA